MTSYLHGLDEVLGAAAFAGEPAIVIRVKDLGSLIKSQSPTGGVLYGLTPSTMAGIVYGQMRDKLAAGLKDQGVNADVTIATSPPSGPPPKGDLLFGMSLGAGAVGVGWGLWHLIKHFRGRR